ncbi:uncharacterized protein B0H18DRAFT_952725 [Fomitopsis serialis]|uniref:uncharacterized protein n=1 Tax=Fomitopsis serialis TaxID=139415 RepID=UPI002008E9FE|nr:uncharacterized protein B0H18DRAFT_952725 [Neoantrodia serialis]KAH9931571.1 hypothetical protein B0H18DRAFT_952725 [Neoantrodia serialis]
MSSGKKSEDRFHYSNRRRIVSRQWLRDPTGEILPRPPPVGTRTPSGLIWGHSCEDFMWLQRVPNVDVLTIWSRSMIKEFAENYDESEFDAPEPRPRLRRPWPVLRLANDALNRTVPPIGAYDDGSDHEDDEASDVRCWRVRADDPKTGEAVEDKLVHRVVIEDMEGVFMPNDAVNPVISPLKHPYAALWRPEVREEYAMAQSLGVCGPYSIVRKPGNERGRAELVDDKGIMAVIVEDFTDDEDDEDDAVPSGLLIPEGDCLLHVRHDPSPVIFLNEGKTVKTDKKGATTSEQEQEHRPKVAESSAGAKRETADVVEAPDAPMSVDPSTNKTESDVEMQSEGSTKHEDDKKETTTDSSGSGEGSQPPKEPVKDKGKGRFVEPESGEGDDHKKDEKDEDQDMADVDEIEDGVAPTEASEAYIKENGCFNETFLADIPKLEEFIPEEYFPDALIVHRTSREPAKYKRIFPKFERDSLKGEPERLGRLYLNGPLIGEGHHSLVRRAPLKLPPPLSTYGKHRMVTVAAKTAFVHISARKFLRHEAEIFSLFPRHLQEEYCGYNLVTPVKHPVPVGAVVPKFYGYYVPVEKDGSAPDHKYAGPILLMEECGQPVVPSKFSIDDRSECYSLVVRLQLAEFLQGSMYVRNILWQPGPLWKPPQERSRKTPSFRIIDFGRAMYWNEHVVKEEDVQKKETKAKDGGTRRNTTGTKSRRSS